MDQEVILEGLTSKLSRYFAVSPEEATKEQLRHPSETALDGYEFDNYIFNTGDLNALREKIQTYVKTLT